MPQEIRITVYTFSELLTMGGAGAARARQWLSEAAEDEWWVGVYDATREALEPFGYEVDDTRFTGFWSQGDGASFTGAVNVEVFARATYKGAYLAKVLRMVRAVEAWCVDPCVYIKRGTSRYVHEHTVFFDTDVDTMPGHARVRKLWYAVVEDVAEHARDAMRKLYRDLEAEYEALTSDESLQEFADANDWWFDARGHHVRV